QARPPPPFERVPPNSARFLPHICSVFTPILAGFLRGVGENVLASWEVPSSAGGLGRLALRHRSSAYHQTRHKFRALYAQYSIRFWLVSCALSWSCRSWPWS